MAVCLLTVALMGCGPKHDPKRQFSLVFAGGKPDKGKGNTRLKFAILNSSKTSVFLDDNYRYNVKWDLIADRPGDKEGAYGGLIPSVEAFGMRSFKLLNAGYREVVVPVLCTHPEDPGILKGSATFVVKFFRKGSDREYSEKLTATFELKVP